MTTRLDKTLKRELTINGQTFTVAMSPEAIKITLKGKRKGQELRWTDLVSGDAALAVALNASVGKFASGTAPANEPGAAVNPKPAVKANPALKAKRAAKPAPAAQRRPAGKPKPPRSKAGRR